MKIQELRPETRKLQFITDSQNNWTNKLWVTISTDFVQLR
jgi:hypothetical protein